MMEMKRFVEQLEKSFDVVLKISTKDYYIVSDDKQIDVYFRDNIPAKISSRKEVITALQILENFVPDGLLIDYYWCVGEQWAILGGKSKAKGGAA